MRFKATWLQMNYVSVRIIYGPSLSRHTIFLSYRMIINDVTVIIKYTRTTEGRLSVQPILSNSTEQRDLVR
jgi:hypothetical protein